jgi:hypothetical protein
VLGREGAQPVVRRRIAIEACAVAAAPGANVVDASIGIA